MWSVNFGLELALSFEIDTTCFSSVESQFFATGPNGSNEKLKLHAAKAGGIYLKLSADFSAKLTLHAAKAGGIYLKA